jgi:TolB-like protein
MSFFSELRRRNVVRMAALYAIASWVILQVADLLFEAMELPATSVRLVLAILLLGWPLVLVFSWVYELTPEGLKREKDVDRSTSIVDQTARKLDVVIIVLLVVAIAGLVANRFIPERATEATTGNNAATAHSIAVLPFVNMSDDASNEFFSDGLSEELLNLLAKIPELHVAARTSSFSFKGEKVDIATIGRQLNVGHVLEGSVRKAGNQVRITAQLVKTDDGFHLWSESFDRNLDNIFAVQDEIAAAVVSNLKVEMLGEQPTAKPIDSDAYVLYLQGRHLREKDTEQDRALAIQILEQSLASEPGFASTWIELFFVRFQQGNFGELPHGEAEALARPAAEQAMALDNQSADAHIALSWVFALYDFNWTDAIGSARRALDLEPANINALQTMGWLNLTAGRLPDAYRHFEHAYRLDPLNLDSFRYLSTALICLGRFEEAESISRRGIELAPDYARGLFSLGNTLLLSGASGAGLEEFSRIEALILRLYGEAMALHALGRSDESNARLGELIADYETNAAFQIASIYAFRGESDLAFEWLNKAYDYRDPGVSFSRASVPLKILHDDDRWQTFLTRTGLSDAQLADAEF